MKSMWAMAAAVVFGSAIGVAPVQAQEIDPGLWEMTMDMDSLDGTGEMAKMKEQMAQMREQLANMPPEARRMMEQQMAARGLSFGEEGVSVRVCLTAEDLKGGPIREGQKDGDCTYTQVKQTGKTWSGHVSCKNGEGDFVTTLHSRTHHTTESTLTSAEHGKMRMKMDARRVSADCGTAGGAS